MSASVCMLSPTHPCLFVYCHLHISDLGWLTHDGVQKAKTKLPERRDFGFPVSDDLGRLQVRVSLCCMI